MSEYAYKGIELTPAVLGELLIQLFDGKQFDRQTALTEVVRYHTEHGGITSKQNYIAAFKRAAQDLKEKGLENISYGVWRLSYHEKEIEIVEKKEAAEPLVLAEKELGEGDNTVYVYYYDTYREFAEYKGENRWPCKIGRTDKDPLQRIISQAGTCYPERPNIALLLHCEDSALLETALHGVLKFQGKWMPTAPGTEWFITSPQEVEGIFLALSNSSFQN